MKKKITMFVMAITLCTSILTGCESQEERKERLERESQWEQDAKTKAEEYVEEKYGIKATAEKAHLQTQQELYGSSKIPATLVDMEYGGDKFQVFVYADTESDDRSEDNYQYNEILKEAEDAVSSLFGDVENVTILQDQKTYWDGVDTERCLFLHNYFDGNNFDELNSEFSIYVDCIKMDLSDAVEIADGEIKNCTIRSFKSEKDMNEYMDIMKEMRADQIGYDWSPLFMDGFAEVGQQSPYYTYFKMGQHDDFYYATVGMDPGDIVFYDENPGDITNYHSSFAKNGKAKFVTPAYSVYMNRDDVRQESNLRYGYVYIYYPETEMDISDSENVAFVINEDVKSIDEIRNGYLIKKIDLKNNNASTFVFIEQDKD